MATPGEKKKLQEIRCCICREKIYSMKGVYQSPSNYALVCQSCSKMFSRDDLELMMSLFFLYGGHFGEHEKELFCLEDALDSIGNSISLDFNDLNGLNQRVVHLALLHGLSPSDFNNLLEEYVEGVK